MVEFKDPLNGNTLSYFIDKKLVTRWDKLRKDLVNKDEDRVYLVDGMEGSGKSVWTLQQAKYIDRDFSLDRVCFTPEDFLKTIVNAKKGQVVVFDEAFRGLSSKSSMSRTNKTLVRAMMEMRQRNLVVFIVLPTFFLLETYAATARSHALFHIYKSKNNGRRCFRIYPRSKKNVLYYIGKRKGFSYAIPRVRFNGYFFNKYAIDEQSYRDKKYNALTQLVDDGDGRDKISFKYEKQQEFTNKTVLVLVHLYKKKYGTLEKACEALVKDMGIDVNPSTLVKRHLRIRQDGITIPLTMGKGVKRRKDSG